MGRKKVTTHQGETSKPTTRGLEYFNGSDRMKDVENALAALQHLKDENDEQKQ